MARGESGRVHTQEETLGQSQKTEERKENFGIFMVYII